MTEQPAPTATPDARTMQQRALDHVLHHGVRCLYCQFSADIQTGEHELCSDGTCRISVHCRSCDKRYVEIYALIGVSVPGPATAPPDADTPDAPEAADTDDTDTDYVFGPDLQTALNVIQQYWVMTQPPQEDAAGASAWRSQSPCLIFDDVWLGRLTRSLAAKLAADTLIEEGSVLHGGQSYSETEMAALTGAVALLVDMAYRYSHRYSFDISIPESTNPAQSWLVSCRRRTGDVKDQTLEIAALTHLYECIQEWLADQPVNWPGIRECLQGVEIARRHDARGATMPPAAETPTARATAPQPNAQNEATAASEHSNGTVASD